MKPAYNISNISYFLNSVLIKEIFIIKKSKLKQKEKISKIKV